MSTDAQDLTAQREALTALGVDLHRVYVDHGLTEPTGSVLAVGLLDGPELLRLTTAPDAQRDEDLAQQLVEDVTEPERGVLPAERLAVEAPVGALVMDLLSADGRRTAEPWTPLHRDLTEPVEDTGLRIEVIGPEGAHVRR